jgi:hypothetical protein
MQTVYEISPDTRALADVLAATSIGEVATYSTLRAALGRQVPYHILRSALNICEREHGVVFANVRKVGYKRLPIEEVPTVGHFTRRHIRKSARRASKRMGHAATRTNHVPQDVQLRLNAEKSSLGLIEHLSRDKATEIQKSDTVRPIAAASKAFLRHIGALKDEEEN